MLESKPILSLPIVLGEIRNKESTVPERLPLSVTLMYGAPSPEA